MYALIDKTTHAILRVAEHGPELAEGKPFAWVECPAQCTTSWSYDGEAFTPPPGPSLADLIERKRAEIEEWRDTQEHAGIVFEHAGREWDGGLKVRTRLQPVIALPALPEGFFWTDHANDDVPMTLADVQALNTAHEVAIVMRGFAIHSRQRVMKEDVAALTDPAAVVAYTVSWPVESPD